MIYSKKLVKFSAYLLNPVFDKNFEWLIRIKYNLFNGKGTKWRNVS